MRKSGWAATVGLGSLVLLLAACGGSSGSSAAAGTSSSTATQSTAVSSSGAATTPAGTASAKPTHTATPSSGTSAHPTAVPQASSNAGVSFPPIGTTVMIVQKSAVGFVLAEASGQVVYTYAKDTKGGAPTCTGACAAAWPPVTGVPKAGPADTFPGTFGLVTGPGGVKQITYDGYPLYTFEGAQPLSTAGNGIGGVWHVVMLSASDVTG